MVTNFTEEYQHLSKEASIAFPEEIQEESDLIAFADFADRLRRQLARQEMVLEAIRTSGLTLEPEKCRFAYEELKFQGHVFNAEGVLPDPAKTSVVANFPRPKDKKGVRRFLGL